MNPANVATYVSNNPGVHFNGLVEALDLAPEKLHRAREQLEQEHSIAIGEFYGQTHYYPPGYEHWERSAIALLRRETSREILLVLLADSPKTSSEIATEVGIARSTLEWQLDRLLDAGLISKNRETWPHELRAKRRTDVEALLTEIEPTLPERWLDRTTRLLDHLLEDA